MVEAKCFQETGVKILLHVCPVLSQRSHGSAIPDDVDDGQIDKHECLRHAQALVQELLIVLDSVEAPCGLFTGITVMFNISFLSLFSFHTKQILSKG